MGRLMKSGRALSDPPAGAPHALSDSHSTVSSPAFWSEGDIDAKNTRESGGEP